MRGYPLRRSTFDFEAKEIKLKQLNKLMSETDFWSNNVKAQSISKEASSYEKILNLLFTLESELNDLKELLNLSKQEEDVLRDINKQVKNFEKKLEDLEEESFYSGEYDDLNAMISINAGAGGVDANDWAQILYRMYTRYFDENSMEYTIEELSNAEEAGIKSVSITVNSYRAYATLESERGVHRLVRISPFDSNKRRHTSFAGVDVIPLIENSDEVEIKDDELRIDVYRSSGAGGQHVNTTDSAVRITHLPTGLVVACQAERSQLQNKMRALELLKTKIALKEKEDKMQELNSIRGDQVEAGWGRQIRSYVMQPYQQVKDSRTNTEVGNIQAVLDGEINIFIKDYLKWRRQGLND
ncbi:MAG: peptide chain release factor 2 [Actinobacteria bacterium]|nr:peptide chain release factor 2 [Actinomycetota bacterium]MBL6832868.1 peptide chain release factor 2 [Candidatus Actinomarina sp.]MDB2326459.1 peptide chain release factor 2 [Candidatus Actinomarina sp.]